MIAATNNAVETKLCSWCNNELPIDNFYKYKDVKKGYQVGCKACRAKYSAEYRQKNKQKIRNNYKETKKRCAAEYRLTNKEKEKNRIENYRQLNKDKILAKNAEWRKANPDVYRASSTAWKKSNPERVSALCRNRRAMNRNASGSHTGNDIKSLLAMQNGKCAVCKDQLSSGYHVDHVMPLLLGGSNNKDNLQLLCPSCNLSKGAKHPVGFMQERGMLL